MALSLALPLRALSFKLLTITFAAMKILMVCLGNICRSPLAEGILESKAKKLGLQWEVDSAGINNNYHIGEAPHPLSQKVAKLHSLDISDQAPGPSCRTISTASIKYMPCHPTS